MTLDKIVCGQDCIIASLDSDSKIFGRLRDLGMINGAHITCLYKSPLGDPTAFLVRGAVIALRSDDMKHVHVRT